MVRGGCMLDENYIVEKSAPLVWAKLKDYGAGELKILDTYLSRINARDEESSCVTFTKKEYAQLMGVGADVRTTQLKEYTQNLLSNVVTMSLPGEGYVQYPLFSEAKCFFDERRNQTVVTIDCNPKLKQAFFNIAKDGYVRYQLKNVINLKSQYSIRLYTFLKARPFGWTVSVDDLREKLGATSSTYDAFKRFNDLILKKTVKEINDITDIFIEMDLIRRGRTVEKIKFQVSQNSRASLAEVIQEEVPEPQSDPAQTSLFEENLEEDWEVGTFDANDPLDLFVDLLPKHFTRGQVELLRAHAAEHFPFGTCSNADERDLLMHDYIQEKLLLMRATPNVKNEFGFLKDAIIGDWH